jgi:hypothetical protein
MRSPLSLSFPVAAFFTLAIPLLAETPQSAPSLLQPYVDKHELAGAIALVADKGKVLSIETERFATGLGTMNGL